MKKKSTILFFILLTNLFWLEACAKQPPKTSQITQQKRNELKLEQQRRNKARIIAQQKRNKLKLAQQKQNRLQIRYINPIASISAARAKQDLANQLVKAYPNNYQKQRTLLIRGMQDYAYLCKLYDADSIRILYGLLKTYYPHFTTIKLFYQDKMSGYRPRY